MSIDPVGFKPKQPMTFNRYSYANNNPYKYVDPDGRNVTLGLAGLMYESYSAVTGNGFNGDMVLGAFAHGYNGKGDGFASALTGDLVTAGAAATGGAGAIRTIVIKIAKAVFGSAKPGSKPSVAEGKITGHTKHGLNQSISRDGGRGVSANAKLDAVKNPTKVSTQANGKTKYTGKNATVVTNKDGKVVTTYGKPRDPTLKNN